MTNDRPYSVFFQKKAEKQLRGFDRQTREIIESWISKNLVGTTEPRRTGKALQGNLKGYWRYRVGDYRIVASIEDRILVIVVIEIGNRREIYR